jgi:hypothetical protein
MYTYLVKNEQNSIQSLESVWGPKANKVVISKDVVFDENFMLKSTQGKE